MSRGGRERYLRAAATVADLVARIGDDAWDGPGLGEWDLRALVGHTSRSLVTVLTYLDQPAPAVEVETPAAYYIRVAEALARDGAAVVARGVAAGEALGADPARSFARLVGDVRARLERAGDAEVIHTIAGGMRLGDYLPTRTFELAVHGLDIAAATGLAVRFESDVLAGASTLAAQVAAARSQGEQVLLALTGRRPLPEGFSVV